MRVYSITPPAERFWAKVTQDGPVPEHRPQLGSCWLWIGGKRRRGYGIFWLNDGQTLGAHQFAYLNQVGQIPDGHSVLHHCDNPSCVRPAHLFTGTPADNMADKTAKGRANQPVGERCRTARLTAIDVAEIRRTYTGTRGDMARLARHYGVMPNAIRNVLSGKTWKHTLRPDPLY